MVQSRPGRNPLFLKTLELAGFKSFVRPTMLEFPAGITALVGPNGSGKSNVVDAIRWCLGEQNARDLRGQRAEDVIHAGRHRVLGSAEVGLTFEAEPDDAPDWSELSVARRLYRSGESEYLINRSRQRLRDVQTRLLALGIDNPRFIVVNQGMTDFLLSATPMERRALLEQAAGLSAYRQRRDEAAHKLAATEQNIATAEIVLAELDPQIRVLRRQARAVEEREQLEERLRGRLRTWYGQCWRRLSDRIEEQATELASAREERRRLAQETERLEAIAEGALDRERAWRAELEAVTAAVHATEREQDSTRYGIETLAQRARSLSEGLDRRRLRMAEVARDADARATNLTETRRGLDSLEHDATVLQNELASTELRVQGAVEALRTAEDALSRLEERAGQVAQEDQTLQKQYHSARLDMEHRARRMEEIAAQLASTSPQREELVSAIRERRPRCDELRRREAECAVELETLELAAASTTRRTARLLTVQGRIAGRRAATSRLLAEASSARTRLEREMGETVLSSLQVGGGWDRAIVSALGEWASLPRDSLSSLTREAADRFLAWRDDLEQRAGLAGRWANSVVESSAPLPAILYSTFLVENEAGREAWRLLSTQSGHLVGSPPIQVVERGGSCLAGAGRRSDTRDDRAVRFLSLRREVSKQARRLASLQDRELRAGAVLAESRKAARSAEEALGVGQRAHDLAKHNRIELDVELEQLERRLSHLDDERQARESERKENAERQAEAEPSARRAEARLAELRQEWSRLQAAQGEHRAIVKSRNRDLDELESRLRAIHQSRSDTSARLTAQRQILAVMLRDCQRTLDEKERLAHEVASSQSDLESAERQRVETETRLSELDSVLGDLVKRRAEIQGRRPEDEDLREPLRAARARSSEAVGRHERALARYQELEGERLRLSTEAAAELGEQMGSLLDIESDDVVTEDDIRRLRSRVLQYADLDEGVVRECRELNERHDHLTCQLTDLRAAADGLREIMSLADAEMRTRFARALSSVSDEFGHVLRIMLRGGDAGLEQVDTEGGVEVRATLPGKRARSNSSFSGGERALVATSLLFAVLRIRPTPFCVLDEVDAALDETNVDRYLAALREISERTQVITVTHNRATMAAANALYGLTMDGDGASSVLSVRLEAYEAAG